MAENFQQELENFIINGLSEKKSEPVLTEKKINLEAKLLQTFSLQEALDLGLSPYVVPRLLRGLPRFYNRENPSQSLIKKHFQNLVSLKRHWIDKALISLYNQVELPKGLSIALFTWVMNDGLGDFYAQKEAAQILKERFPSLEIRILSLIHKGVKPPEEGTYVYYENSEELTVNLVNPAFFQKLATASLILQMPTYFPDTPALLEKIGKEGSPPFPKYEHLGEYGFVDTDWCHPETPHRSLGLHFLEKGILTKKVPGSEVSLLQLSQKDLLKILLESDLLDERSVQNYHKKHALNAAYFTSGEGAFAAIHALIKKREKNNQHLDLIVANFGSVLDAMEKYLQQDGSFPLLKKYGIKEVQIYFEDAFCPIPIQEEGKTLRLIQGKSLSSDDFLLLITKSSDFVVCRGDRSFSEVVSAGKIFLYDPPYHAKNFLKDLIALAENRLGHSGSAEFVRLFFSLIKKKPDENEEYVEEDHFFIHDLSIEEIGNRMGELLSDPETVANLQKFNEILLKEYSANSFLVGLVARALFHYKYPEIERLEKNLLQDFLQEKITFSQMISQIRLFLPH